MQNHNQFFSDNTQFEINSLSNDRSRLPPAPINTNIQDLSYNDLGILGSSFQMQSTPLARRSNVSARRSEGPGFLQTTQLTEILTADGEQ